MTVSPRKKSYSLIIHFIAVEMLIYKECPEVIHAWHRVVAAAGSGLPKTLMEPVNATGLLEVGRDRNWTGKRKEFEKQNNILRQLLYCIHMNNKKKGYGEYVTKHFNFFMT